MKECLQVLVPAVHCLLAWYPPCSKVHSSKLGAWYPPCSKVVGLLSFDIVAAWPPKNIHYLPSGMVSQFWDASWPCLGPLEIEKKHKCFHYFTFAYLETIWHPPDASGGTMECPACLQEGSASLQECPVDPQMSLRRFPRVSRWSPKVSKSLQKVPQSLHKVSQRFQMVPQSLQKLPKGLQKVPNTPSQQASNPINQQASSQQAVSSKKGPAAGAKL